MFGPSKRGDEGNWMSLSDMMTVLMLLFLIISVAVALTASTRLSKFQETLAAFLDAEEKLCQELDDRLSNKFRDEDLEVECNPIRVIFTNPKYEFEKGRWELTQEFELALKKFFPVYMETIDNSVLRDLVDEIRIEGHTDSDGPYMYNMGLSQQRAKEVLNLAIELPELRKSENYFLWSRSLLTANGLSFSRRLSNEGKIIRYPSQEIENKDRSRRVEVKLRTKSKEVLMLLQKNL